MIEIVYAHLLQRSPLIRLFRCRSSGGYPERSARFGGIKYVQGFERSQWGKLSRILKTGKDLYVLEGPES